MYLYYETHEYTMIQYSPMIHKIHEFSLYFKSIWSPYLSEVKKPSRKYIVNKWHHAQINTLWPHKTY